MHSQVLNRSNSKWGCGFFCSSAYPGSTTDKEIVVASGVLDQLRTGDNVMADKGFLLLDVLPDGEMTGLRFYGARLTAEQVILAFNEATRLHLATTQTDCFQNLSLDGFEY